MGRVKEKWAERIFFCGNCAKETEHYTEDGHYKCDECRRLENEQEYEKVLDNSRWA